MMDVFRNSIQFKTTVEQTNTRIFKPTIQEALK